MAEENSSGDEVPTAMKVAPAMSVGTLKSARWNILHYYVKQF